MNKTNRKHGKFQPIVRTKIAYMNPKDWKYIDQDISPSAGNRKINSEHPGGVILISKRGLRVEKGRCAECSISESKLWRYAKSNRGTICLCSNCKAKVFERSFGKSPMDLLDRTYRG